MRYAIFSDIHGNLPAWERVLADIKNSQVDALICLGDVVGYGPKPQEVLDSIRAATDHFVLGNHDAAAAGLIDPSIFNDHAQSIVYWTREHMTQQGLDFFKQVPLEIEAGRLLFVHAEVPEPGRFGYIENEQDAAQSLAARDHFLTFVGHTHHPEIFEQLPNGNVRKLGDRDCTLNDKHRYIVNVGSVGEPRNPEDIRARYVIYDDTTNKVDFRRIEFESKLYQAQLRATSMTHTPFFLQVLEKRQALGAVLVQDMQVPAHVTPQFVAPQRRTLVIPNTPQRPAGQPITGPLNQQRLTAPPIPTKKKSLAPLWIFMSLLTIVAGFLAWKLLGQSADTNADLLVDNSKTIVTDPTPTPKIQPASPATTPKSQPKPTPTPKAQPVPRLVIDGSRLVTYRKRLVKNPKSRPASKARPDLPATLFFDGKLNQLVSEAAINPKDNTTTILLTFRNSHPQPKQQRILFNLHAKPNQHKQLSSLRMDAEDNYVFLGNQVQATKIKNTSPQSWQIFAIRQTNEPSDNLTIIHNNAPPIISTRPLASRNINTNKSVFSFGQGGKLGFFRGHLGEIRIYDAALSSQQLKKELDILQKKWGLPYKMQIPELELIK